VSRGWVFTLETVEAEGDCGEGGLERMAEKRRKKGSKKGRQG
jgi:hypothetical protein